MIKIIPKAFVDFYISFSEGDPEDIPKRTGLRPKLIFQDRAWKLYVFERAEEPVLPLFHYAVENTYRVWCLGEIFQYKGEGRGTREILTQLARDLIENKSAPQDLNGHFILIIWNEGRRQLEIWTNRLGTFHSYYITEGSGAKAIGSFFAAVSNACPDKELDWVGLTGLFGFGYFPEDRTYHRRVRIMDPASRYVFNAEGGLVGHNRYWEWGHSPDRKKGYLDVLSEFDSVIKEVLKDQSEGGSLALPISGGLDSRTIAAVLAGRPGIHSYSYGWGDKSVEVSIAGKVAQAGNFPFEGYSIGPNLFDRLDLILKSTEGFHDLTLCRQASCVDRIYALGDYLLLAHWADVWFSDMGIVAERLNDTELVKHIGKKIGKQYFKGPLENMCRRGLGNISPDGLLRDIIQKGIGKYAHLEDRDFRVKAFKTDSWSFRWTLASVRMFQPAGFPRLPFYDNRITDFFCGVPSEFVKARRLQVDYLKKYKPRFARITWQAVDTDMFHLQYFNNLLMPKRAVKKIAGIITRKKNIRRNWEMQFIHNKEGRAMLEHWLLRKGLKIHAFVPTGEITPLINILFSKHYTKDAGSAVSMLLTFSVWLEQYG